MHPAGIEIRHSSRWCRLNDFLEKIKCLERKAFQLNIFEVSVSFWGLVKSIFIFSEFLNPPTHNIVLQWALLPRSLTYREVPFKAHFVFSL